MTYLLPHQYLKRYNLPSTTGRMLDVLGVLRDALQADSPYIALPDTDSRTIKALFEREWIAEVSVLSVPHFGITGRGLKALKVYESPTTKRSDGLCPRCCERPRAIRKTGVPQPYCKQCESQNSKRQYKLGLYRMRPQGMCARCQKRPRFVASTGKTYSYCRHCKNLNRRREHRRERKQLLARLINGEHVACIKDGCDKPRYVSGKSVQDYCYQHYREYQNKYSRERPAQGGK